MNPTDHDRLELLGAAEHSLRVGKAPLRLFLWMIDRDNWPASTETITCQDEDAAVDRLRQWRRQQFSETGWLADLMGFGAPQPALDFELLRDQQLQRLATWRSSRMDSAA